MAWQDRTGIRSARLSLLGDAVIEELCGHETPMHETEACSTGMYDVYARKWREDAIEALGLYEIKLPQVENGTRSVAYYASPKGKIPLYAAVGDQQAAILGAFLKLDSMMINVGTGAQAIYLGDKPSTGAYELRALFSGITYKTITRLPGGRALNVLVRFIQDIGARLYSCPQESDELWKKMIELSDVEASDALHVDMSFADVKGGSIREITENNLYFDQLLSGAYKDMVCHYASACKTLCGELEHSDSIVLGGGIMRKIPRLARMLEAQLHVATQLAPFEEDVLAGLARLAFYYAGACVKLSETDILVDRLRFIQD